MRLLEPAKQGSSWSEKHAMSMHGWRSAPRQQGQRRACILLLSHPLPLVRASPLCRVPAVGRFACTVSLRGVPVSLCSRHRRPNGSEPTLGTRTGRGGATQGESTDDRQASSMRSFGRRQARGSLACLRRVRVWHNAGCWLTAPPLCVLHSTIKQSGSTATHHNRVHSVFRPLVVSFLPAAACLLFLPVSVSAADRTTDSPHTAA